MFGKKTTAACEEKLARVYEQQRNFAARLAEVARAAAEGDFSQRLDMSEFEGDLAAAASAINAQTEVIQRRAQWFWECLDAIPFPLSITDEQMRITGINKPVCDMLGISRKDALGRQCGDVWKANICNTSNCGIAKLRANQPRTTFQQGGYDFQVDTSYLKDSGGQKFGHIEVVQDITASARASAYQSHEVERFSNYLSRLAEGDLSFEPEVGVADQHTAEVHQHFRELAQVLETTLGRLRELIGGVQDSAAQVAGAGEQLQGAAQQTAQATQHVAAAIQQVSSSAQSATTSSQEVAGSAVEGAEKVRKTVTAMTQIKAQVGEAAARIQEMEGRSSEIGKIVERISEIAEQTNLLALNAAIEAARAGDQGRGFAVVADEVRKLAERASSATKEIEDLIQGVQRSIHDAAKSMEGSLKQVDSGAALAEAAGGALESIVSSSSAADQQIEAISHNAEDLAAMTEEVSAQSEEVTASAESLREMAGSLTEMVSRFRLADSAPVAPPTPVSIPPLAPSMPSRKPAVELPHRNGNGMVKERVGR